MDPRDLYELCRLVAAKGTDHADARAAVHRLERISTSFNQAADRVYIENSSSSCHTAKVVLFCVEILAQEYQLILSSASPDFSKQEQVTKQAQNDLAIAYAEVAECWDKIVGKEECDKLAVATSASTAGVFEVLAKICGDLVAQISTVLTAADLRSGMSSAIMLAVSLVKLWRSFVTNWPSSGRVLFGKHLALLAQPVARLILLLLHDASHSMQRLQGPVQDAMQGNFAAFISANDGTMIGTLQTAFDACVTMAERLGREFSRAAETVAARPAQQEAVVLQDLLDSAEVPAVFAVGAACYILIQQELWQLDCNSCGAMQQGCDFRLTSDLRHVTPDVTRPLQATLQFEMLCEVLGVYIGTVVETVQVVRGPGQQTLQYMVQQLSKVMRIKPSQFQVDIPTESPWQNKTAVQETVNSIMRFITHICNSISKPASAQQELILAEQPLQQQQEEQDHLQRLRWLSVMSALSKLLQAYVQSIATPGSQLAGTSSATTAGTSSLVMHAMLATLSAQLSKATSAGPAAVSYSTGMQDIITSIIALEGCFRCVGAGPLEDCGEELLEQAKSVCSIIAAHKQQLLGVSAALDKAVRSLLMTCVKLAQLFSTVQPEPAAILAWSILSSSTAEGQGVGSMQESVSCASAAAQDVCRQAYSRTKEHGHAAHSPVSLLAGRCLFTMGCVLQRAADKQPDWLAGFIQNVHVWAAHTSLGDEELHDQKTDSVAMVLNRCLAGFNTTVETSASSTGVTTSTVTGCTGTQQAHTGLTLAKNGAALSTEHAVSYCCNNPSCVNLARDSELLLVKCKGSVCSGCHRARYCSKTCQKQHWKQHKQLCLKWKDELA